MTSTANSCAEASYTTLKGLQFSLYCNQDQTDIGDIDHAGADTVEDCLNLCSVHAGTACGAVGFDSINLQCYFKTINVTAAGAVSRDGWILGIANSTQYQPLPFDCMNSGQNQTAQNGLAFTVYCNQNAANLDYCVNEAPDCRVHTSSLEQCLNFCSTMHPLCTGVAWDSILEHGYTNCYPKIATSKAFDSARAPAAGTHSAKALLEVAPDDCYLSANGTTITNNNETFNLFCGQDRVGTNMIWHHADSLDRCIDSCVTYPNDKCFGVVFDATMVNGYENCYLKSSIGGSKPGQSGFTFAMRQNTSTKSPSDASNPTSDQKHKGSKNWIAGPAIGAVAIVTVLWWWWWWWWRARRRRRRRRKETPNAHDIRPQEGWLKPELDNTTVNATMYEMDVTNRLYEMESTLNRVHIRES
ncbi:hypothetical protein B0O99DRAFT_712999 [Bisporella sp. PMI_857]|nr:hypothetical protein B0O99DRAFT_712999 [Bisporella sp. PMI_857]